MKHAWGGGVGSQPPVLMLNLAFAGGYFLILKYGVERGGRSSEGPDEDGDELAGGRVGGLKGSSLGGLAA